jgi:hypothetical protein
MTIVLVMADRTRLTLHSVEDFAFEAPVAHVKTYGNNWQPTRGVSRIEGTARDPGTPASCPYCLTTIDQPAQDGRCPHCGL